MYSTVLSLLYCEEGSPRSSSGDYCTGLTPSLTYRTLLYCTYCMRPSPTRIISTGEQPVHQRRQYGLHTGGCCVTYEYRSTVPSSVPRTRMSALLS